MTFSVLLLVLIYLFFFRILKNKLQNENIKQKNKTKKKTRRKKKQNEKMESLRSSSPSPLYPRDQSLPSSNLSSSSIVLSSSGIHEKALSGSVPSYVPSGASGGSGSVPKYERICIPMSTEDLFYQSGGGSQAAALALALAYPVAVFRYLKEKLSADTAVPTSGGGSTTTTGGVCSASKGGEAGGGGTCCSGGGGGGHGESREVRFERALWALGSLADGVYVSDGSGVGDDDDRDVREVVGSILDKLGDIDGGGEDRAEDPGAVVEDFVVVNLRARYIEMVVAAAAAEAAGGDYQDQAVLHCGSGFD